MPGNAETESRRQRVVDLRMAGASYRQIAQQLGISTTAVYKHMQAVLKALPPETPAEVSDAEVLRLDRLMMALWPQASSGNFDAIDRVLKIMDRRSRLLGLAVLAADKGDAAATPPAPTSLDELRKRREARA